MISIQRKTTRIFALYSVLVALFFSAMAFLIAFIVEDAVLDKLLDIEAAQLFRHYTHHKAIAEPGLPMVQVFRREADLPPVIAKVLRQSPTETEIFTRDKQHYHVRRVILDHEQQVILVAEVSALLAVSNMKNSIAVFLLLLLLLTLGLAAWLAHRIAIITVRPILSLQQAVVKSQDEHTPLHFDDRGSTTEIHFLANVIKDSLTTLQQALKREQNFTRDISHELRTPLTVLNNLVTLRANGNFKPQDIESLAQSVRLMTNIADGLLQLARNEQIPQERVLLRPLIESILLDLYQQGKPVTITLNMRDNYTVDGQEALLRMLFVNLVENAIHHGKPDEPIVCNSDDNGIEVSNACRYTPPDNPLAPSAKHVHSDGIGQGLYLVRRLCEALGWQLKLRVEDERFYVQLISASSDPRPTEPEDLQEGSQEDPQEGS